MTTTTEKIATEDLLNERRQLCEEQRDLAEEFSDRRLDCAILQLKIDDIDCELAERRKLTQRGGKP